jgi:hypothetical protein
MIIASPTKLAMLCRVLHEAYDEAKELSPGLRNADEKGLKTQLARLILDAYANGEAEPRMLKRIALVRFTRDEVLVYH